MWFLNASTRRLEAFTDELDILGGYAILSHRWAEEEVTFDEIHLPEARTKQGYQKIEYACAQAVHDGYDYVWIDTCCIDKRSSAELSEAINSMFRWYRNARVCYVYLVDFDIRIESTFRHAVWWSRGWTLQELIAPPEVQFYDFKWHWYGDKLCIVDRISDITKIDVEVLKCRDSLPKMSVAKRMSWAARRVTSRKEDQAYSLLGLFDVNMPLLYGEGGVKAFYRLQEEIIRKSSFADHSILAWMIWEGAPYLLATSGFGDDAETDNFQRLLAPSPYGFRHGYDIVSWGMPQAETFVLTSRGLRLSLLVRSNSRNRDDMDNVMGVLNCRYADQGMSYITIWLQRRLVVDEILSSDTRKHGDDIYDRRHHTFRAGDRLKSVSAAGFRGKKLEVTLAGEPYVWPPFEDKVHVTVQFSDKRDMTQGQDGQLMLVETFPTNAFDGEQSILSLTTTIKRYNKNSNPAFGAMVLAHPSNQADRFVLTIDRLHAGTQSPQLYVDMYQRRKDGNLADLHTRNDAARLLPDETREIPGIGSRNATARVAARCVMVAGDLFWSLGVFLNFDQ